MRNKLKNCIIIVRLDDLGDAAIWSEAAVQLYEYYRKRGLKIIFVGTFPYKVIGQSFKFYDEFILLDSNKFTLQNVLTLAKLQYCCQITQIILPAFSRYLGQGYRRLCWAIQSDEKVYVDKFKHNNWCIRKLQAVLDRCVFTSHITLVREEKMHELCFNREVVRAITGNCYSEQYKFSNNRIQNVLIFPGCKDSVRRWPTNKFLNLAKTLIAKGFQVELLAVSGELDLNYERELSGSISINTKLSLSDCIQKIKSTDCVIGNDSGPIHVAKAFGKSAIVLGWGGMYDRFLNYPEKERFRLLFEDGLCGNCGCSSQSRLALCLRNIDVQKVADTVVRLSKC